LSEVAAIEDVERRDGPYGGVIIDDFCARAPERMLKAGPGDSIEVEIEHQQAMRGEHFQYRAEVGLRVLGLVEKLVSISRPSVETRSSCAPARTCFSNPSTSIFRKSAGGTIPCASSVSSRRTGTRRESHPGWPSTRWRSSPGR